MINNSNQVLVVNSLGIRRSERWLFRNLNFELASGEVIQVVGKNGAGKTSLLRSLCGLLPHAEGEFTWSEDNGEVSLPVFLGHLPAVKPELTVMENLKYHPLGGKFISEQAIEAAIDQVRLGEYFDIPARNLSAGQTRRVGLARLLLADANCWVLDEPFTSLDVEGCRWLENKISDFVIQGGSVLITSHQAISLDIPLKELSLDLVGGQNAD